MGLHVHDVVRFDFAQVGKTPLYFFVFFPNNYFEDLLYYQTKWFKLFSNLLADDGIAVSPVYPD